MFIIIELQTTDGVTSNIVTTKESKDEAMSTYHSILAAAAISNVRYHTAVVMDEKGKFIAKECYQHQHTEIPEEVSEVGEGSEVIV